MLHLIRHAPPRIVPSVPSWEWGLDASATEAVGRLRAARVLPAHAWWVSSTEPKAMRTAGMLAGGPFRADDRLREAIRDPEFLDSAEFQRRVLRSFNLVRREAAQGWEPLIRTSARVLEATEEALVDAEGRDVVLVGHGTALTLLVSGLVNDLPDIRGWETMLMPDHCALVVPDVLVRPLRGRLAATWGAWAA